jgi:hypothetical protein
MVANTVRSILLAQILQRPSKDESTKRWQRRQLEMIGMNPLEIALLWKEEDVLESTVGVSEVASMLGESETTICQWTALAMQGKHKFPVPASEKGKEFYWRYKDILEYYRQKKK